LAAPSGAATATKLAVASANILNFMD